MTVFWKRLDPDRVVKMGLRDTVDLDPNRDPDAEKRLRNTWSKDHERPAGMGAKTGKEGPKRINCLVRKPGPTFVISRSPVQVRPVAPLAPGFRTKTGCFAPKQP